MCSRLNKLTGPQTSSLSVPRTRRCRSQRWWPVSSPAVSSVLSHLFRLLIARRPEQVHEPHRHVDQPPHEADSGQAMTGRKSPRQFGELGGNLNPALIGIDEAQVRADWKRPSKVGHGHLAGSYLGVGRVVGLGDVQAARFEVGVDWHWSEPLSQRQSQDWQMSEQ